MLSTKNAVPRETGTETPVNVVMLTELSRKRERDFTMTFVIVSPCNAHMATIYIFVKAVI